MLHNCSGSYILFIYVPYSCEIITKSKKWWLEEGLYIYVGSAKKGIKSRINYHLRIKKKKHWHIDYLLEKAKIIKISVLCNKKEVEIAQLFTKKFKGIKGFGSSDTPLNSHLFKIE